MKTHVITYEFSTQNKKNIINHSHEIKKICNNKKKMDFQDFLQEASKKLLGFALILTNKNYHDSYDLIQMTILKLIEKEETVRKIKYPYAYAKKILENKFNDEFKKQKRVVFLEDVNLEKGHNNNLEELIEYDELQKYLRNLNEIDQTILTMLGTGHSYKEIQDFIGDISMSNLRVRAIRARANLAKKMGKKL